MRCTYLTASTVALALLPSMAWGGAAEADRIVVTELTQVYELTVPVSRLVMDIPKGGLTQVSQAREGSMASRRYFYLEDKENHLFVSGWFEPENEFPGIRKFWDDEIAAWTRKGLPKAEDSSFKKIGNWDAVIYHMPCASCSNPHIRAHWLQAGTWIDVHLSVVSEHPKAEATAGLESLLTRFRVSEKSP